MLTTPDHLLFLHLLRDDIQNELFHHLSRGGGEADQPVLNTHNSATKVLPVFSLQSSFEVAARHSRA